VGPLPRGPRRLRRREPAARAAGHRRGPLRQRDRPGQEKRLDKETGKVVDLDELVTRDEGIRPGTTVETLANLKPAFKPDGKVTAGNSLADHRRRLRRADHERGEGQRARPHPAGPFHTFALAGVDPVTMLTGPIPATEKVLEQGRLSIDDIDLFEINEAFASVVLAWEKEHGTPT
jgi:acetyl-CoA acyltransferase